MNKNLRDTQEGIKDKESVALQGPMTKGRLRRLQEEVQKELGLLQGQGGSNESPTQYTLFFSPNICLPSHGSDLKNSYPSHVSGSSRSHRSHRHEHNERVERHGRHRRESFKCKFSPSLGENKLDAYEIKVEQLFECHDIGENLKVKLVTLEFNALV
ncbi:hypothetical protein CR513_43400, partial [Mucuna pruriens]